VPSLVETHYLPRIAPTREHIALAVDELLACVAGEAELLGYLLESCALRLGPLQGIPRWLRGAARKAGAAGYVEVAVELGIAAAREQEHRLLLVGDLVAQREVWRRRLGGPEIDLRALVHRSPHPAARRHAAQREAAHDDPLALVAVELELAELGRVLGPDLVSLARLALGRAAEGCLGFVRARLDDAERRRMARERRLEQLLDSHAELAESWADTAAAISLGYLAALDACTQRSPASEPLRAAG
jgi:hypothetical protein